MAGWGNYQPPPPLSPYPSIYNHNQPNSYKNRNSYEEKKQSQPSWAQGAYGEPAAAPAPQSENLSLYVGSLLMGELRNRELQQKEYILQIKEEKLNAREEELKRREAALNDWPAKRFGFVCHNIKEEIPEVDQRMVYLAYYTWILTFFGYIFNWLIIVIAMFAGLKMVWEMKVASFIVVIGVPASFLCWYKWGINSASRTSGNFVTYGCFYLNFLMYCAWICFMFVPVPVIGTYSASIISMLTFFHEKNGKRNFLGILSLIVIVVWGIVLLMSFWLFGMAVAAFRKVDLETQVTDMVTRGVVRASRSKLNDESK
eukprot:TRINITY_DN9602_c0_g1_i4.p1 TRINITY_DN9602_c0_g1~~TRINITY_DN9602_c0_g1_i4.p1  ORF type:complete len:348 (-),score=38.20 TRINITY_DN9602_c0_g1_i4:428-1369(-)